METSERLRQIADELAEDQPHWTYSGPNGQDVRIARLEKAVTLLIQMLTPPSPDDRLLGLSPHQEEAEILIPDAGGTTPK